MDGSTVNLKDYVTVAQAAKLMDVDPAHVRLLLRRGKLAGVKLGDRMKLVSRASARHFKRQRRRKSNSSND